MAESNTAVAEAPVSSGKPNPHATMPLPAEKVVENLTPDQEKGRKELFAMIASMGGQGEQMTLPLSRIHVARGNNIRMESSYTEDSIQKMMSQIITAGGLIQPVVVVEVKPSADNDNRDYALIIGFRRLISLKRLEAERPDLVANVKVIVAKGVKSLSAVRMLQLLENKARQDLSPMEEALTIEGIIADSHSHISQREAARMLGYSDSQISKLRSFLQFPEEIQEAINDGTLSFANADRLRRDIPASQWKATLPTAIAKSSSEFEDYAKTVKAKYNPEAAATDGEAEEEAEAKGGSQKPATMLRSKVVSETFIPFLKDLSGKVDSTTKKFTEADIIAARIDTMNAVLLDSEAGLSKLIAPHLEAEKAKKAAEEAAEEATSKSNTFWKARVKDSEALVELSNKPDPKDPDKKPLLLAQAYVSVINDVYKSIQKQADGTYTPTDEQKAEFGFDLPKTTAAAAQILRETHLAVQQKRVDDKKKKEEKKAEEAAKEAAEKAAAEAGTPPADPAAAAAPPAAAV